MSNGRQWIGWSAAALLGLGIVLWAFPRVFQLYPQQWSMTRSAAIEQALESFSELGQPVAEPFVVAELDDNFLLEKRLQLSAGEAGIEGLADSSLGRRALGWRVTVYEPEARPGEWTYRAELSTAGELTSLRLRIQPEEEGAELAPEEARRRADAFLTRMGFDLGGFDEPALRRTDQQERTDLSLRYRDRETLLGEGIPYGIEVTFAGDRLAGFAPWMEDPEQRDLLASLQPNALLQTVWILMPFLLFPCVALFFLRRYHAGEVGVARSVQVFALVLTSGALLMLLAAKPATEGSFFGLFSRAQVPWAWGLQMVVLWFGAVALVAALSWSVGEARCREHWGGKLAAFDALFQRRFRNATVARSSLRGVSGGIVLTALILLLPLALRPLGVWVSVAALFGPWWHHAAWPGLTLLLFTLVIHLYTELFAWLFLLPAAVRRLGTWGGGAAVALTAGVLFWPPLMLSPVGWFPLLAVMSSAVLVMLFLRCDLLTALTASLTKSLLLAALPFLLADAPSLQLQGALPLLAVAVPLLLGLRHLHHGKELVYRWEDVPPHVRRIAERERQRVELETARGIQSSILPDLPPQLAGVELAHAYLPASEVGGDFYDVLDLEDGRLAVAVGDVAGHGVSSGLVMSMAKSTLALQVTVNPEVDEVLGTLNRMVYRSARLRLLTTLCYALVDHQRRELTWASAGHIAPYRIDTAGTVQALSSASYPLGVRDQLAIERRTVKLAAGDTVFLFSDGVVEARKEGTDELFGFERLEESLARHAEAGPAGLRDGVLSDLRDFTGPAPREDDQTIVVLRLPAA